MAIYGFMQKAVKISQHLTVYLPDITTHSLSSPTACPPVPEAMQVDSSHLSRPELARRLATGLCLYCGFPGHLIRVCPSRPPCPARFDVTSPTTNPEPSQPPPPLCMEQMPEPTTDRKPEPSTMYKPDRRTEPAIAPHLLCLPNPACLTAPPPLVPFSSSFVYSTMPWIFQSPPQRDPIGA
ncbi:hypothetical protein DPX16_4322 [Anabarilius grahami]|uniref:CCHC-type domain-containing protein n=1 Tax=Anabarilius grahami TaxID=495550 RepID=A0A3N0YDE9_ANAGA|nr:hypothetical protein DPX16_4322 [Anabarilius grahami]